MFGLIFFPSKAIIIIYLFILDGKGKGKLFFPLQTKLRNTIK